MRTPAEHGAERPIGVLSGSPKACYWNSRPNSRVSGQLQQGFQAAGGDLVVQRMDGVESVEHDDLGDHGRDQRLDDVLVE